MKIQLYILIFYIRLLVHLQLRYYYYYCYGLLSHWQLEARLFYIVYSSLVVVDFLDVVDVLRDSYDE